MLPNELVVSAATVPAAKRADNASESDESFMTGLTRREEEPERNMDVRF